MASSFFSSLGERSTFAARACRSTAPPLPSRKHRLDDGNGLARIEVVNHLVRIENGNALLAKVSRNRALSHADRASEPRDDHAERSRSAIAASTAPRSSAVTCGRTPNQASKPGTA